MERCLIIARYYGPSSGRFLNEDPIVFFPRAELLYLRVEPAYRVYRPEWQQSGSRRTGVGLNG